MKFSAGFTLIELLVVIAVMVIVGVFALVDYSSFGEDKNLKNAVLDIQNLLKQAQANATANAVCNGQYGATWYVQFIDANTISLLCVKGSVNTIKTLQLNQNDPNISIQSIGGSACPNLANQPTINFAPLSGAVSVTGYSNCTSLTVTLQNSKITGPNTKSLIIETGGRFNVQ